MAFPLRRLALAAVAVVAYACASASSDPIEAEAGTGGGRGGFGGSGGGPVADGSSGTAGSVDAGGGMTGTDATVNVDGQMSDPFCSCAPGIHNDRIILLSDTAEIWSFDPATVGFQRIANVECAANPRTFTLAVDPIGRAWVLLVSNEDLQMVDVNDPMNCEDPGFAAGDFGLFGMTFSANSASDPCVQAYLYSYSGQGPFEEGPDLGDLASMDPRDPKPVVVSPIDFDGGELAGTGDGRLFAFAGPDPAKLVEYDKATGAVIEEVALTGFSKTNASAFAFFGGDIYFFTEATPVACDSCISNTCQTEFDTCQADPMCKAELDCAFAQFNVTDDCGGLLPQPVIDCVFVTCGPDCFPAATVRTSKVTKLDFDNSEGNGRILETIVAEGPIRVVGADSSTCVPIEPPR